MVFSLEIPPRDITERVWDDKLVVGNRQSLKDMEIWQFSTKPWEVTQSLARLCNPDGHSTVLVLPNP